VPEVHCKGLCLDSCGPIAMTIEEDDRLQKRGVRVASMVDTVAAVERGDDYYCPALHDGRCTVYDDRPTICRLWGATTSMPCPHGCTPANALSQQESYELLALAADVGGGMALRFLSSDTPDSPGLSNRDQSGVGSPDGLPRRWSKIRGTRKRRQGG
jgi:hypothetical protein